MKIKTSIIIKVGQKNLPTIWFEEGKPSKRMKTPPRGYQPGGYKPSAECSGPPLLISQGATVRIERSVRNCTISAAKRKKQAPRASLPGYASEERGGSSDSNYWWRKYLPTWREKAGIDFTRNRTWAPWAAVSPKVKYWCLNQPSHGRALCERIAHTLV